MDWSELSTIFEPNQVLNLDKFSSMFIGVADIGKGGRGVADRFTFVDGSNVGLSFFSQPRIPPWDLDEPDDGAFFGENCVE